MQQVRISGLVRLAKRTQQSLAGALSDDHRNRLKTTVERGLQQVRDILARHGQVLTQLPEPSQRAHRFLATIDWSCVPTSPLTQQPPRRTVGTVQLSGFASGTGQIMHRLSRSEVIEGASESVYTSILEWHRVAEDIIRKGNIQPEQLTPQSWAVRGWLAYLASRENFDTYTRAVAMALPILERGAEESGHRTYHFHLYFCPMRGLYRLRGSRFSVPTPWIGLDGAAFTALADLAFGRDRRVRQAVLGAMYSEPYQDIQAELESLAGVREESQGAVHDLGASFDRVNQQYFAGAITRPKLNWSRAFTGRIFGHYDYLHDRLMVSRTLDQAAVPGFVVDHIMYHELLHKRNGVRWEGGRSVAHTPQFRADERQFEKFAEAEAILKQVSRQP